MQKKQAIIVAIVIVLAAAFGAFAYVSTVGKTQPSANANQPGNANEPGPVGSGAAAFGEAETIAVGETAEWDDGLEVKLERIDDSRCQPGVVCIWQGELSATFTISGGTTAGSRELRLGTETAQRASIGGYSFVLQGATATSVTLRVEKLVAVQPGPKDNLIRVSTPAPNALVSSPLRIEGEARGTWYFEASFPVKLLDANGKQVAAHYATALGEWMTEDFVPFASTLEFAKPATATGTLVLQKDNPSGLPEHDDEIRIPVRFVADGGGTTLAPCKKSGCSGQVCSDDEVMTTCEYREEYACYKTATCERQADGQCGWTPTPALASCLSDARPSAL